VPKACGAGVIIPIGGAWAAGAGFGGISTACGIASSSGALDGASSGRATAKLAPQRQWAFFPTAAWATA